MFPRERAPSLDESHRIMSDYMMHHNTVRLHSAIGDVTPQSFKLEGREKAIFEARDRKLAEAREQREEQRQRNVTDECQPDVTVRLATEFEVLKANLSIATVLNLLGIEASKPQHRGACPLHGSSTARRGVFNSTC